MKSRYSLSKTIIIRKQNDNMMKYWNIHKLIYENTLKLVYDKTIENVWESRLLNGFNKGVKDYIEPSWLSK
jgi:hypothetical protein